MKVDFTKIQLSDIDGKNGDGDVPFYKTIANLIYCKVSNLDLVETAREINQGKEVELSKTDLRTIRQLLLDEKNGLFAFARKAIRDFLEDIERKPEDE